MSGAMAEMCAAAMGLILIVAMFAWLAFLPTLGLLWILGWLS